MYSEPDPGLPRVSTARVSWPLEITAPKRPCRSGKGFGLKGGQLHHLGIGGQDCDCKRAGRCHESFSSPIFMRLVFVCTLSSCPTPPLRLSLMFCALLVSVRRHFCHLGLLVLVVPSCAWDAGRRWSAWGLIAQTCLSTPSRFAALCSRGRYARAIAPCHFQSWTCQQVCKTTYAPSTHH
jgi:hypothetical protein